MRPVGSEPDGNEVGVTRGRGCLGPWLANSARRNKRIRMASRTKTMSRTLGPERLVLWAGLAEPDLALAFTGRLEEAATILPRIGGSHCDKRGFQESNRGRMLL